MDNDKIDNKPENTGGEANQPVLTVPSPKEIKKYLDKYVVGQDDVKITLAVAAYNHYMRIQNAMLIRGEDVNDAEIEKSNILITGSTGTGKTLLAKSLARMLGVPFAIADATTLTQAGYVGEDVENVIRYLWQNSNYNAKLTEIGIIYIDEIDKIATKTNNVSITRDVSGEGVQQALLKIVEGTVCRFPLNGGRKHPDQKYIEVDTSNILFICGGAFVGLDDIIKTRVDVKKIGFNSAINNVKSDTGEILPEDLITFGLIPEFIGRLPIIVSTKDLNENDLVRVLKEPKNSLVRQYEKLFKMAGITLTFDDSALSVIAKAAIIRKTGARGLRAEFEKITTGLMYEYAGGAKTGVKLNITESFLKKVNQLKSKKK